jgi:hypothetical protein
MADLTISSVRPVKVIEQYTWPNGESLAKGHYARLDGTSGKAVKGNGSSAAEVGFGGVVFGDDGANTVTLMRQGILDVGEALAGLNFGAVVYLSDTDATLADGTGTVTVPIGHVIPGWGATTPDKLLQVNVEEVDL